MDRHPGTGHGPGRAGERELPLSARAKPTSKICFPRFPRGKSLSEEGYLFLHKVLSLSREESECLWKETGLQGPKSVPQCPIRRGPRKQLFAEHICATAGACNMFWMSYTTLLSIFNVEKPGNISTGRGKKEKKITGKNNFKNPSVITGKFIWEQSSAFPLWYPLINQKETQNNKEKEITSILLLSSAELKINYIPSSNQIFLIGCVT